MTSSRGIIENIKKVKSKSKGLFFFYVWLGGSSSKKFTAIRGGGHAKTLAS